MTFPRFGGDWTAEKLEILRRYLDAYTTVLSKRSFNVTYVDAFAGSGSYVQSASDYSEFHDFRRGSTQIALDIKNKPFDRLIFIEKEPTSVLELRKLAERHPDRVIEVIEGNANDKVPQFCKSMTHRDRAVVFLDPFATEVSWETVAAIAETEKIDCWILFPLMAVTRMMPRVSEPTEEIASHLDRVFGGEHYWREHYRVSPQLDLFNDAQTVERLPGSDAIAESYRERLVEAFRAGSVAKTRRTLRNSNNSPLFELFFGSGNPKGADIAIKIADHILKIW